MAGLNGYKSKIPTAQKGLSIMPSPFVYRLINGYINGSTIKVGQGRKAFFGFAPTIDTEPFLFYGFTPTIDTEPFLLRFCPDY